MKNESDISVINYLNSLCNEDGSINFSKYSSSTFLSSSFGTMIHFLVNRNKSQNGDKTIGYFKTGIDPNFKIRDPKLNKTDLGRAHNLDYIESQIAYFSMIALDSLGYQISQIPLVDKFFASGDNLKKWFNNLNFKRFWHESNKIMFVLYFFFYLKKYGNEQLTFQASKNISVLLNLLNNSQDPETGFWGTNHTSDLYNSCFGAAHIYIFYDYLNMEIPFVEKIIDNTLKLHHANGLIKTKYGGACEDYNAIEIYLRCSNQTDYRRNEILEVLSKMKKIISGSQNNDGGYPYKIAHNIFQNFGFNNVLKREYTYSSWEKMKTLSFKSDLWATWFRLLSIKVINYLLEGNEEFNSYDLPAWGFIKKQEK